MRSGLFFIVQGESKRSERSRRLKSVQDVRGSEWRGAYAGASRTDATQEAIPPYLHASPVGLRTARHVKLMKSTLVLILNL